MASLPIRVGWRWILPWGRERLRKYVLCVCAFKSPQARAQRWESHPVPFSWPLRGGLFPFWVHGSRCNIRGSPGKGQPTYPQIPTCMSWLALTHCFLPSMFACTHSSNLTLKIIHKFLFSCIYMNMWRWHPDISKQLVTVAPMAVSHSLSHVGTKNMNVCVCLKIVVTQWMWGRSCNLSNL